MQIHRGYDRERALQLLPLLHSIAAEIEERTTALARLEHMEEGLSRSAHLHEDELANLRAEVAIHKRELRYTGKELRELGCSLDEAAPLTIRIPGQKGDLRKGYAWRPGDSSLRLYSADSAA